jgi:ATP-binding cassette subfamily B protein
MVEVAPGRTGVGVPVADPPDHQTSGLKSRHRSARGPRLVLAAAAEVLRADRRGTIGAAALQVVGVLAALGTVGAGKLAFDAILEPLDAQLSLAPALLLLALLTALSGSVGALQSQQQRLLSERVSQRIWDRVMARTASVDLIEYERHGFTTQLERVVQNALNRPYQVTTSILGLGGSMLGVGALSAVLLAIEPLLVPILLAAGIPATLLARRASKAEFAFSQRVTTMMWRRSYLKTLLTQRSSAAELRAFGAAGRLLGRHALLNGEFLRALRTQVRVRQMIALVTTLGVGVALGAALLAIVELVRLERIDLAEAGAAAIAVRLLSRQLSGVFGSLAGLIEAVPFLADLEAFVACVPAAAVPIGRARRMTHGIQLRDVRFAYPEQDVAAVDGVDLEIAAGEVVALVGENGSGKTTLAMMVAGLYEPTGGTVVWDGDPAVPMTDIRASVSVIMQDFVQYQMTVSDNITISDPDRTVIDDEVTAAARRAGVLDVIDRLPAGPATMLGRDLDDGTDLSGGQWQRMALARALYRDASLIVLDEPTAALDPRAEHELFQDVRRVLEGRAALLISHRFSSVRLADRIYVLDAGRVLECGTHDELMVLGGRYAELFSLQSAAYR